MNDKKKYIGLTIGPINATLSMAKKTREIWAASYLFSYVMKKLINQLQSLNNKIIVPNTSSISDAGNKGNKTYAGLFPDRLILQADDGDFKKIEESIKEIIKQISMDISEKIGFPAKLVQDDLENYLQIYFIQKELKPEENPILKLSPLLDALERHSKYIHYDSNQTIPTFLKYKKKDFLSRDAGLNKFESLVEIGTRELRKVNETAYDEIRKNHLFKDDRDEDETSFIQALKSNEQIKNEFKIYHKYIAVVQADGDNIGKTIENKGNDIEALKNFSKKLTSFAQKAALSIQKYGGTPVYAGGDDLLFFAPVVNRVTKENGATSFENLFDLIDTLDKKFKLNFPAATLSYGISITYHKFPLDEALEEARNQLFQHAKKFKDNNKEKNAVAFRILKHSGRSFGTIFYKELTELNPSPTPEEIEQYIQNRNIYTLFKNLLSNYDATDKYLRSIVHNLNLYRGIFKELFENVKDEAVERIKHFFENSFDEPVHSNHRTYIDEAAELVYKVYTTAPPSWKEEQKFQAIYAVLRTLHFFNKKDKEQS